MLRLLLQVKASKRPMCQSVKLAHMILVPCVLVHQIYLALLMLDRTATHWYFFPWLFSAVESTSLPNRFGYLTTLTNQLRSSSSFLRYNIHLRPRTHFCNFYWVVVAGCWVRLLALLLSFSLHKINTSVDTGSSMAKDFVFGTGKPVLKPVVITVHAVSSMSLTRLNVSLGPWCPKLSTSSIGQRKSFLRRNHTALPTLLGVCRNFSIERVVKVIRSLSFLYIF